MDGRMDGEGCGIDRLVAFDNLAQFVDEDERGDIQEGEVC